MFIIGRVHLFNDWPRLVEVSLLTLLVLKARASQEGLCGLQGSLLVWLDMMAHQNNL